MTDGKGKVIKTYEYDSFGNEITPDSKDENPFRYCGEYYDKETESLHLYTYCYNNPVVYFDNGGNCLLVDWAKSKKVNYQRLEKGEKIIINVVKL